MIHRPVHPIRIFLIIAMVGYATFFSIQLILHYYSFGSRALDLGNMGQAIWNTAHGRFFHQTNQPGAYNRLSLHVEPILIPISLLYRLYSGPEILFIFQSSIVALGAIPVFGLARFKLKNEGLALIFALIYLMFPAIQGATLLDFHAVTLAPPFLLTAFYYLESRQPGRFALFAGLAVACKEDMTLLILMMGLYALVRKETFRLGIITVTLCLLWVGLAVFVIPPTFAGTENIHWGRYDHLGDSPARIVLNMFVDPGRFLDHLRAVEAMTYLRLLLTPTAFLALLNPVTLLLALPSLGINLLSNFPPMQRVNSLIYAAPVVPAVLISSIYGATNLKRWLGNRLAAPRFGWLFDSILALLLLGSSLLYHLEYGYLPGGGQFRGWEEITPHHRRAEHIFEQIPPEAALSAQDRLNPHVSQRETLYIFDRIDDADHILLDVTLDSWPLHPVTLRQRVDHFLEGEFGIVAANDGYLLLAKNRPELPTRLPDAFFDFARVVDPKRFSPQFPASVTFANRLQLLGYELSLGAHEKFLPVITLYWRALVPLEQDYTLWPFVIDRSGRPIEDPAERPIVATLWYPTSAWSPDEIVITRTLPRDLAPQPGAHFTLAVGVAEKDWADPAQRLPITQAEPDRHLFDNGSWLRLATFQRTGPKSYRPVEPELRPPQQAHNAQFWNIINLTGVELPTALLRPGDPLPFTLQWQSEGPIGVDLTTFAHLRDQAGNTVAQLDWTPQDGLGYLPTTAWQPGRPVIDRQRLDLPPDLPSGAYYLAIGWYYAPSGERLPITANGRGDLLQLGPLQVKN